MADFKGKPVELNAAPEVVFARLSDFSNLNEKLEELPAEMREAVASAFHPRLNYHQCRTGR